MFVYVVTQDFGYEGFNSPEAVFSSLEKAKEYLTSLPNFSKHYTKFDDDENITSYYRSKDKNDGYVISKMEIL